MEFLKAPFFRIFADRKQSKLDEFVAEMKAQQTEMFAAQQQQQDAVAQALANLAQIAAMQQQSIEKQANQERQERKGFLRFATLGLPLLAAGLFAMVGIVAWIETNAVERADAGQRSMVAQIVCNWTGGLGSDCAEEVLVTFSDDKNPVASETTLDAPIVEKVSYSPAPIAPRSTVVDDVLAACALYGTMIRSQSDPYAPQSHQARRSVTLTQDGCKIEFFPAQTVVPELDLGATFFSDPLIGQIPETGDPVLGTQLIPPPKPSPDAEAGIELDQLSTDTHPGTAFRQIATAAG